jgi:hypothetical protein
VGFPLHGCWVFGQIWNIHFLIIGLSLKSFHNDYNHKYWEILSTHEI